MVRVFAALFAMTLFGCVGTNGPVLPNIIKAFYEDTGICPAELQATGFGASNDLKGSVSETRHYKTTVGDLRASGKTKGGGASLVFDLTGTRCEKIGRVHQW